MNIKKVTAGDLLYHPVHGVCRIDRMIRQNERGKEVLSYSLVPKIASKMKVRFVITDAVIEASGFHSPVSVQEANHILDYLKAGDSRTLQTNQTWALAQTLLSFSSEKFMAREQRKRQLLEYSAKGLVGELAFVFKITLKETAAMIQKCLGKISNINLSVIAALAHAGED